MMTIFVVTMMAVWALVAVIAFFRKGEEPTSFGLFRCNIHISGRCAGQLLNIDRGVYAKHV